MYGKYRSSLVANKPTKPELCMQESKLKLKQESRSGLLLMQVVKLLESIKQQVEDTPKPNES